MSNRAYLFCRHETKSQYPAQRMRLIVEYGDWCCVLRMQADERENPVRAKSGILTRFDDANLSGHGRLGGQIDD